MKINNNIQALNAYRNLYQNQQATSSNLEKLSSGLRINRAADDAAGLAISEKMRSQIKGLKMAERNALDGISLMQTSEGALQEVHAMLQRMRELSVQAANDTNTDEDREQLQKEIDQLKKEIDSVSEKTEFNTRKLLDGSSALVTTLSGAQSLSGTPEVQSAEYASGSYELQMEDIRATVQMTQSAAGLNEESVSLDPNGGGRFGTYTINVREYDESSGSAKVEVIGPQGRVLETKVIDKEEDATVGGISIKSADITGNGTARVKLEARATLQLNKAAEEGTDTMVRAEKEVTTINGEFRYEGIHYPAGASLLTNGAASQSFTLSNNALAFQIGPNTGQEVMIDIPKMDTVTLGITNVSVASSKDAGEAIFQLDRAVAMLSDARAKLGAVQNRLEHTINNLQVTHENLTSSESRIRDADMALEMTEFTRNNILNQSATAMLAQANQLPQGVLQLLQ
ncbi:flagellin [Alkalicoccus luteus]|uniref:Flagellin n=1 Tax=Alkalicoccus luteus TaxID=1237094 RepID=A0A969PSP3_9BACI|nr:flagellin [Alkalicoccus luteus]NJP38805.1 flagellin [Alkalicoccus luteus]